MNEVQLVKSFLAGKTNNAVSYFDVEYYDDYDVTYFEICIHYWSNVDDYSYYVDKAKRDIYDAIDYANRNCSTTSRLRNITTEDQYWD